MGDGGEKGRSARQRVKGRHGDLWFGSAINRSVRGTVVAIPCNKSDMVRNIPLIIPPCQVVATNMSDFNKHKVSESDGETGKDCKKKKQAVHKETETKATPKKKL